MVNSKFKLTPEMVTAYVGVEPRKSGKTLIWPCPECKKIGRDKDDDNLTFDTETDHFRCYFKIDKKLQNHQKQIFAEIKQKYQGSREEIE